MAKRILVISPTPTHPGNAGNRVHILSLCKLLAAKGCELHFMYIAFEDFDEKAMRGYWGERLYIIERDKIYNGLSLAQDYLRRAGFKLARLHRWWQKKTGAISSDQKRYNSECDSHFPPYAVAYIKDLQQKKQFDTVICEYAFMSKCLTLFDEKVFKVLDTHDRFTDRFSVYLANQLPPRWISLYGDQEKKALDRANLVLAVQETEKKYFESISDTAVTKFTYVPDVTVLPERNFEQKLLFFASNNDLNQHTFSFFIESVLPSIVARHPQVQVLAGGSICREIKTNHPNIKLMGEFDDVAEFYAMGDIAINPEIGGTGYKVKTLEALAYGLPVVSTRAGAAGVLEPFMDHLLLADNAASFAAAVNKMIEQPQLRASVRQNAVRWFNQYRDTVSDFITEKVLRTN